MKKMLTFFLVLGVVFSAFAEGRLSREGRIVTNVNYDYTGCNTSPCFFLERITSGRCLNPKGEMIPLGLYNDETQIYNIAREDAQNICYSSVQVGQVDGIGRVIKLDRLK